ncbi:DUF3857 domain-containing protein [Aestuariibaculum sp. M13]|uniref:DUF3857 domain-containing protein n=1 Tax=Aestuariibaculum sp. M13 TaxID=2967132 RepID=UPI002159EA93|nr:DUF3857 domain-containing protein [Aestuariibaculum sp. M13]MCR8669177.1 DUF3857 domain-containing protein [Aestuariibaculum sp. M13]
MTRKLIKILTLFISLCGFSQEYYNTQGYDVTYEDLKGSSYEADSEANALIIYESVQVSTDIDFEFKDRIYFIRKVIRKIKILNESGLSNAIHYISLYNNELASEKVENIRVITHNMENNEIIETKLNKDLIKNEKHNKHRSSLILNPQNVKIGSVITYNYTIKSPFLTHLNGWQFQEDIPKLYSKLELSIPENFEYDVKIYGDIYLTDSNTLIKPKCFAIQNTIPTVLANSPYLYIDCFDSYYIMKNIPAFKEEAYTLSKRSSVARIEFELKQFTSVSGKVTDYTKFHKDFDDEVIQSKITGRQLTQSQVNKILPDKILSETNKLIKAKEIYNFIQKNYNCNGVNNIVEDFSLNNVIDNKSGNAQSINLLLLNALNEADIKAKPVILSTRDNGLVSKINFDLSDFNYLLAEVELNKKTYLLDASNPYLAFGEIPFKCLNQYGMGLNSKNNNEWIDIDPLFTTNQLYNLEINIDKDQNVKGTVACKKTGYHALNSKQNYFNDEPSYFKNLTESFPDKTISDFAVSTLKEDVNLKETYNITYTVQTDNNTVTINPFLIKYLDDIPLKSENRIYPINFGFKDNYLYMFQLNFNDSYSIKQIPEKLILELPDKSGTMVLSSKVIGNSVNLIFKINFNQAIYQPDYYQSIKEFLNELIRIQENSNIILERKQL